MIRQSLILLPSLLLCILSARGQHLVLDSYGGEATVSATESITLTSGFHVPLGSTFRAYITESSAPVLVGAIPSGDRNYVITYVTKRAGISNPADPTLTTADVMPVIQYYDGLGRPVQRVQVKGSPSFKDLVQYQAYDVYGREIKQYLPYAEQNSTDGSFKTDALNNLVSYYSASSWDPYAVKTAYPFAETVFESSPLDRVLQQGAPGSVWQPLNSSIVGSGHTVQSGYGTNTANSVRLWNITGSGADGSSFYGKGELYKTTLTDENGNRTIEYKDKEGRVVLKQAEEVAGSFFNTYYVYDDFGQLRYVIPPGVAVTSFSEGDTEFNQFIYAYRYDGRKRVVEKKVPGKAWEYMVYNPLDQLVLTQDGNQRTSNQWTFQKYDAFGRVVITGLVVSGSGRAVHQTAVDGQSALWEVRNNADAVTGYSNSAYPTTGISSFLTINYYDDYSFFGNSFGGPTGSQSLRVQGLLTGTKVNILGSTTMLLTSHYYDDEGRVIQTKSQNHLGGADTVTNTYSFTNELLTSHREHTTPGGSVTIANRYEYDHAGRRLEAYQSKHPVQTLLI